MQPETVSRYDIHGLCTIDIEDRMAGMARRLVDVEGRYQCFRARYDPAVTPDLHVTIGDFQPDRQGCTSLDDVYLLKEDYLCHLGETYKLGAGWRFDVTGLDSGPIELRIAVNLLGRPFIAGKMIDFFVFYILLRNGAGLLHASAAACDGKALVFGARGGGGKTTLALYASFEQGWDFLGDNFVILRQGMVYSYLSDLNMFGYNLHPRIWQTLNRFEKTRFRFWALLNQLTMGYIKVFSPVSPLRFVQGNVNAAYPLKSMGILQTGDGYCAQPLARAELAARMMSNMKLEFMSFVRHAAAYGCVFPESDFANLWQHYADRLAANLSEDASTALITVPERITEEVKTRALADAAGEGAG